MLSEKGFVDSAISGVAISMAFAFIVLLIATKNWI